MSARSTWIHYVCFAGALVTVLAFSSCRPETVRPDAQLLTPPIAVAAGMGVLGPLDVLNIRVFDEPEISGEYRVDADGTLTFPFLGAVSVDGKTPGQVAELLQQELADGYLIDPALTVYLKEANSREVVVMGYVKKPGSYPYRDGMTVIDAIALAGGVDDSGGPRRTAITRYLNGEMLSIPVNLHRVTDGKDPNVLLLPNDIINIPESTF